MAAAVDIPLYVEFIIDQKYTLTSYSFHKVSSAFLFAAFSITISDWAGVLYDINEYDLQPFLLRKATLVGINVLYALVSLLNFIFCYTLNDFDSYTNSSLYILGIFFQITVSLLLTLFMLSSGLKLAWRIHGVSGAQYDLGSHGSGSYGHAAMRATNDKQFQQFSSALWNLNMVMGTCAVCIILQVYIVTYSASCFLYLKSIFSRGVPNFIRCCCFLYPNSLLFLLLLDNLASIELHYGIREQYIEDCGSHLILLVSIFHGTENCIITHK